MPTGSTGEYPAYERVTTGVGPPPQAPGVQLTLGHILTIAGMLGSLGAAYGGYRVTQADVERSVERIQALESRVDYEREARSEARTAMVELRSEMKALTESMGEMKRDLKDIKSGVVAAGGRHR